ncbi:MAG: CDP-alcohol phosphatidyltransferase family protein [Vicinamibacterales bacterium]
MIPQRMYIVSMEGADVRFLGGLARARNERVATRGGATLVSANSLASLGSAFTLLVPAGTALMVPLFADAQLHDAEATRRPCQLVGPDGARLFAGPASALAAASNRHALEMLPIVTVSSGSLFDISTRAARRTATRGVLLATQKATDGFVSRTFNRPLSRLFSRAALAVGMSATGASLVTLGFGLACAWAASKPGYAPFVVTGILFQLASVLDGVDGEIARATLTESDAGARVDTLVDQLTYLACFAGMTIGWMREGSGTTAVSWTVLIGLALVASVMRAGRFVERHADNASFVSIESVCSAGRGRHRARTAPGSRVAVHAAPPRSLRRALHGRIADRPAGTASPA